LYVVFELSSLWKLYRSVGVWEYRGRIKDKTKYKRPKTKDQRIKMQERENVRTLRCTCGK